MEALLLAHPFWGWMVLGAVLLALEVATGSGYLLWPAAAAGVVALLTGLKLGLPVELLIFALLTIAGVLLSRRYLPKPFRAEGHDVTDPGHRLAGQHGHAVDAFTGGVGRVFVDGKEWAAELDGESDLAAGAKVKVSAVLDGARLKVKAA